MLIDEARSALYLLGAITLPVLLIGAIVGMFVAALQAASQVQDQTLAHLPRLIAVGAALIFLGPWMAHEIAAFAEHVFTVAATVQ